MVIVSIDKRVRGHAKIQEMLNLNQYEGIRYEREAFEGHLKVNIKILSEEFKTDAAGFEKVFELRVKAIIQTFIAAQISWYRDRKQWVGYYLAEEDRHRVLAIIIQSIRKGGGHTLDSMEVTLFRVVYRKIKKMEIKSNTLVSIMEMIKETLKAQKERL